LEIFFRIAEEKLPFAQNAEKFSKKNFFMVKFSNKKRTAKKNEKTFKKNV
jgi:hypothetical protein